MKGRTVLYIPIEALTMKPEVVAKDKALVQRLESEYPQPSSLGTAVLHGLGEGISVMGKGLVGGIDSAHCYSHQLLC